MVRGRKPRAAATAALITITSRSLDDHLCASPKRKDCKLDNDFRMRGKPLRTRTKAAMKYIPDDIPSGKTRSQTITKYFHRQPDKSVLEPDDNACDSFTATSPTNIFLQAPVLHLDIDKSPNQPSSIVINKQLDLPSDFVPISIPGFQSFATNVVDTGYVSGRTNSVIHEIDSSSSSSTSSSGRFSCDSGVVADKLLELSPSRRRKPTTPHRIVCPSPIKHVVEKSPSTAFSNLKLEAKKGTRSKRKLIINQSENVHKIDPAIIDLTSCSPNDAIPDTVTLPAPISKTKNILYQTIDPSAKQNTNNNKPTKLTDFYPVRRSARKTKKAVDMEHLRSIEEAIRTERQDGLMVKQFADKGRGIVASRPFNKGEFVVEYIGDFIDPTEASKREQIYAEDENTGCYMYYFKHKNQQYCIDATAESDRLGRLVNHSRNGNLLTRTVFYKNRPHLVLIAKETINEGEELTYDYGDRSKESLLHHPWLAL